MFNIILQKSGKSGACSTQPVCLDTLYEAELMALELATKHFKDKQVMLVHRSNLLYDIYEIDKPIGSIQIRTG